MSATNGTAQAAPIVGAVEDANERGVRIAGQWLNLSKFGPPVELPGRGELVSVTVDAKGFIRGWALLEDAPELASPPRQAAPSRERTITRLACLKAAAEFAASRPEARSADVVRIAACWERWANRPDDAE